MKKIIFFIIGLILVYPLIIPPEAYAANPKGQLKIEISALPSKEYTKEKLAATFKNKTQKTILTETAPDQILYIVVMVSGYQVNDKSFADLTGDFELQNPDGTLMFNVKGVFSYKKSVLNPEGSVLLDPSIKLMLEKKDQKGIYIFRAMAKDNISGGVGSGEYSFALVDNKI